MRATVVLLRRASLTACLALGLAADGWGAEKEPLEYVSPDHWVYADALSLQDEGYLAALSSLVRPWSRVQIADALCGLPVEIRPDPRVRRMLREFARELAWAGHEAVPRPALWEMADADGSARLSVGLSASAEGVPPSAMRFRRGSGAWLRLSLYAWPSASIHAESGAFRSATDRDIGDSLIKGEDLYLDTREAYFSARALGFEVSAGLASSRWGPGRSGTLLWSGNTDPFPMLRYRRVFVGRLEFEAASGALVAADQRYVAAHRLTLRMSPTLSVGVAEAVRYNATSPDLLYVVGIVPYTLVERFAAKNRGTMIQPGPRNNVMMSADLLWRPCRGARCYAEILLDDLTTESDDAPHRLAWQVGMVQSLRLSGRPLRIQVEMTKVFRYTYGVYYGYDFEFNGRSIGHPVGPDRELGLVAATWDPSPDWSVALAASLKRAGETELGDFWDPEVPEKQWAGSRLTGVVESTGLLEAAVRFVPDERVVASVSVGVQMVRSVGHASGKNRSDPSLAVGLEWAR